MNKTEARARVWAIVAAVLDGRRGDLRPLLDDLEPDDLTTVVHGLAHLACLGIAEGQHGPALAARVREQLLKLAIENGPRSADD
ncbi:hypothetical protein SSP531S_24630 [Streptomyces spongiicola]|uniref:BetI-type transcriptional repressor C-terminal domain-containing protein n=1 Tax=Streptomyces spongiicola TaxID=1690221 RepID=A0A388SWJ8_9ACTN|nr:hypothetical protein [Streptomyces spongiicola]GBQ01033.1 hypothetical protein SSP531S_24630 [Streptomyces spongiicola]